MERTPWRSLRSCGGSPRESATIRAVSRKRAWHCGGSLMVARVELETVYFESVADGVVMLTLNRPEHGNGVVPEMARDLLAALIQLEQDQAVRVLVLTGAGRQFCAGADLGAFQRYLTERHAAEQEPYNARVLWPVRQRTTSCRMPMSAAINGGAPAGGAHLSPSRATPLPFPPAERGAAHNPVPTQLGQS